LLYYGDEIGMREATIPRDQLKDPVGIRHWPENPGRDGARTPMQWTPAGGFADTGVEPWLPAGDAGARNVVDQGEDPGSMLHLCRDLIELRREREDLHSGTYEALEAPDGVWAWRRGTGTIVVVNHGDTPSMLSLDAGEILLGTERGRAGERVNGAVGLDPWEAVVVATDG
jgi:alpha-glucosidase